MPNEVAMEKMRRYAREIAGSKHEILREDDRYRAQRAGSQIPTKDWRCPLPLKRIVCCLVAWILLMNVPEPKGKAIMTTITATADSARKPIYESLLSRSCRPVARDRDWNGRSGFAIGLQIFSDAFLKLISMIVAPIVFCVVVHGIAGAGDLKKVGRVGVKALIYFEVMTTVALVVGLVLAYLFGPGHGMNIDPSTLDPKALTTYADNAHKLQGGGSGASCSTSSPPPLRRAVAQRRAAGAVLRGAVRHRPGAGRRRKGREDHRLSRRYRPCCSASWA